MYTICKEHFETCKNIERPAKSSLSDPVNPSVLKESWDLIDITDYSNACFFHKILIQFPDVEKDFSKAYKRFNIGNIKIKDSELSNFHDVLSALFKIALYRDYKKNGGGFIKMSLLEENLLACGVASDDIENILDFIWFAGSYIPQTISKSDNYKLFVFFADGVYSGKYYPTQAFFSKEKLIKDFEKETGGVF